MNKQEKLSDKHAKKPRLGDYWHEMFAPICVILDVTPEKVVFCATTVETKDGRWTWGLHETNEMSREEFRESLEYPSLPGKYMASVLPTSHKWAVREYRKILKGLV